MEVYTVTIVDTHLHTWNLSYLHLPWLKGASPFLNRNYSEEDYLDASGGEDIRQAVYVEVAAAPEERVKENHVAAKMCSSPGSLINGAIISGDLEATNFPDYLAANGGSWLKGVRQVLNLPSSPPGRCLGATFAENVRYLGKNDLLFEACLRCEELGDLVTLARKCPHTRIVLDHMGNVDADRIANPHPTPADQTYADNWRRDIEDLAALDNVFCKISGLSTAGRCTAGPLRPAVTFAIEAFGENRVLFGGNFPVCNLSTGLYPWIEALMEITEPYGEEFQQKLFSLNAIRIYHLNPMKG